MKKSYFLLFALFLISSSTVYGQTTFIVDNVNDDSNARDANPGDGNCSDMNGRCTLRAAIDEANASSGQEVIIILPGILPGAVSGAFNLSRVAPNTMSNTYEDANAYGDLDINGSFKRLTLQGTGTPGPSITISPNDRILDIVSGGPVIIERIHFTGGTARAGDNGNPDNSASYGINGEDGENGGAIRIQSGNTVNMDQLTFSGNTTQSGGNGVPPASNIDLIDGGNGGTGGHGGAIFIDKSSKATILRSTFSQNGTGDGGSPAGGQSNGEPAQGGRGGYGGNGAAIFNLGELTISSSTISDNLAGSPSSGAAGVNGGEAGAAGAGGSGGGIANSGLVNGEQSSIGFTVMTNVIAAGNTAGDNPSNGKQPGTDLFDSEMGSSFLSQGYNLLGTNDGVMMFSPKSSDIVGSGSVGINPELNGLNQNDDEAVPTREPRANSMALNKGTQLSIFDYDGRGFERVVDGKADIGAHERQSTPFKIELTIMDFAVAGSSDEFVTIKNPNERPVQLDDYTLVFFPEDFETVSSCYSVNLFGELAPGGTITVGDDNVSSALHSFTFDATGPLCGSGAGNELANDAGAIGLYKGDAGSLVGFVFGNYESARADFVEYDNIQGLSSGFGNNNSTNNQQLQLFSNPTDGPISLRLPGDYDARTDVQLLNQNGAQMTSVSMTTSGRNVTIDGNNFPKGVYYVRVIQHGTTFVERIILH